MKNAASSHGTPPDEAGLLALASEHGVSVPFQPDTAALGRAATVGGVAVPNRIAFQPMEGCDGNADGSPGDLTLRRYARFAAGGAGLIWCEATAVVPEGRANPRQLWLHERNVKEFANLVKLILREARNSSGIAHKPFMVLQLTHSGRYSRPEGPPRPVIAHHNPHLDPAHKLPEDYPLITDDELERLEEAFVRAARLAFEAGFDAVDVKSCHRYLISELLACHTRAGKYGGSYENRTAFLKNVLRKIRDALGEGRLLTPRLGVYDGIPHPHGWGMARQGGFAPDWSEPARLASELAAIGVPLLNLTMGNPYHNPHVNRPYGRPVEGMTPSPEHPILGIARMIEGTRAVRAGIPRVAVVGSGLSWLRNLWPNVGAACVADGTMEFVGVGRQAFAWPGCASEILSTGKLDRRHTCIACSGCTWLMRKGTTTGCVIQDKEVYGALYERLRAEEKR